MTDADLVLGRLDPAGFNNGRMKLDVRRRASRTRRSSAGGSAWTPTETAAAAVRLVDANMTDAVRRVLSLAGADPRKLSLVAFGGMGGVHATSQARALGMRQVLIPRAAAGFSALGLLTANHVIDDSRGVHPPWPGWTRSPQSLAESWRRCRAGSCAVAGVPDERVRLEWSLLLVYPGQTFDASIPVTSPPMSRGR